MMNKPDVDVDSIITQLLSVKDQPGKQASVLITPPGVCVKINVLLFAAWRELELEGSMDGGGQEGLGKKEPGMGQGESFFFMGVWVSNGRLIGACIHVCFLVCVYAYI